MNQQSDQGGPSAMALAYAEWLAARAALEQMNVDPSRVADRDKAVTAALDRIQAADWKIIQTPARDVLDVRQRAIVLQQLFLDIEEAGEFTDNRHKLMLTALIHDVFGLWSPKGEV